MTKNFFQKLLQENPRLTHNSTILSNEYAYY